MKRSFGVLLSSAVALAFGLYFVHQAGHSPASTPMSARVSQSAPGVEAPGRRAASDTVAGAGSDRRAETQQQEMAALREQVALLRREVSAVQRQIHEQGRAATVVAPGREEDLTKDPRTDPAARAAAERERQEQMAVLEANFRQEPTDRGWAFQAAGAVQEALASDEMGQAALRNIECRSSTCRVELADDDTGELAKGIPMLLQQLDETLPSSVTANYVDDGAGGKTMILYMSRELDEPPQNGK
jgi:hypothetical protein